MFKKNKKEKPVDDLEDVVRLFESTDSESDESHDINIGGDDDLDFVDNLGLKDKEDKKPVQKKHYKQKKNNRKNSSDFINLDNTDTTNFIVIGHKNRAFGSIKTIFKALVLTTVLAIIAIVVIAMSIDKAIQENIKGKQIDVYGYSILSNSYQPNLDELKIGDSIICLKDDQINWVPLVYSYDIYEVASRNGVIIYCVDKDGNDIKIESTDVAYIISGNHVGGENGNS